MDGPVDLGARLAGLRARDRVGGIGNTLAILPIALSSVLKVREMPEPVQEPTPAEAEFDGGLLVPRPLPVPADA